MRKNRAMMMVSSLTLAAGILLGNSTLGHAQTKTYYDTEGNEIQMLLISEGSEDDYPFASYDYTFDSQGRMATKTEYIKYTENDGGSGVTETVYEYEYNEKGQLSKCISEDYTKTYEYDENGNLIWESGSEGEKHVEYQYNNKNQLIETDSYDIDGELTRFHTYEYDEDGNMVKDTYMDGGYTQYFYDEDGKKIGASVVDVEGDCVGETDYEYDENGNLISETNWNEGESDVYQYEYISVEEYL